MPEVIREPSLMLFFNKTYDCGQDWIQKSAQGVGMGIAKENQNLSARQERERKGRQGEKVPSLPWWRK